MKWFVGQEVVIRDVNEKRQYWDNGQPPLGVVTKVGRKLFTVSYGYGESVYRIKDGTKNDNYGHSWVQTPEDMNHISKILREIQDAKETQWKAQFRAVEDAVALLYTISWYDGDVLDNAITALRAGAGAEADADSGESGQEWAEFIFETLGRE